METFISIEQFNLLSLLNSTDKNLMGSFFTYVFVDLVDDLIEHLPVTF